MAKSIQFPGSAGNRYEYPADGGQHLEAGVTMLAVVRILSGSSWISIIESQNTTSNLASMGRHSSGNVYYSDTTTAHSIDGLTFSTSDNWAIIAVTRPSGSSQTIRGHKHVIGGSTTHVNGATGNNIGGTGADVKFIIAGDDDPANIRVAAWAIWDGTALSDSDFETIASELSTQAILDLNPTACFDAENGLMLTDLTEGGMDGSLVGSITESSDGPAGWTYFGEGGSGPQNVPVSALTSAASFGTAAAAPGGITEPVSALASASAFGAPSVASGGLNVQVSGLASASAFGSLDYSTGPVTVSVTGLGSAGQLGSPTTSSGSDVPVSALGSASAFGTPNVSPGPATVQVVGLDSAQSFVSPTIEGGVAPTFNPAVHGGRFK